VQLINTRTDDHLWGETYDRDLTQIFEIQSDLARGIATALQATYTSAQGSQRGEKRTESNEAYKLYIKGRHHWNKRTVNDLTKAVEDARKVLAEIGQLKTTTWWALRQAELHAALGGKDEAIRRLYYEPRAPLFPGARVNPAFNFLYRDPRFRELMKKVNLPLPEPET
jgi:hypothetical protein